jgi:hypothetical protein
VLRCPPLDAREFSRAFAGEGQYVEFKCGVTGPQLQDTAAGRPFDASTLDDIHRALQSARDIGRYSITKIDVDGRAVCAVSIARRREGFAQTSGGVVKVRRGSRDDPLFGAELVRFANERTATRYETTCEEQPGLIASRRWPCSTAW